jgi:small subunit ribosomal protein S24e
MKLEITTKKENPLIGRTEINATLVYQGTTPSNQDVLQDLAKQLSLKPELIVVKQIKGVFSEQKAIVRAFAYSSTTALSKYEMSTKHLRKLAEEKAKKEAEKKKSDAEAKKKVEEETAAKENEKNAQKTKEDPAAVAENIS